MEVIQKNPDRKIPLVFIAIVKQFLETQPELNKNLNINIERPLGFKPVPIVKPDYSKRIDFFPKRDIVGSNKLYFEPEFRGGAAKNLDLRGTKSSIKNRFLIRLQKAFDFLKIGEVLVITRKYRKSFKKFIVLRKRLILGVSAIILLWFLNRERVRRWAESAFFKANQIFLAILLYLDLLFNAIYLSLHGIAEDIVQGLMNILMAVFSEPAIIPKVYYDYLQKIIDKINAQNREEKEQINQYYRKIVDDLTENNKKSLEKSESLLKEASDRYNDQVAKLIERISPEGGILEDIMKDLFYVNDANRLNQLKSITLKSPTELEISNRTSRINIPNKGEITITEDLSRRPVLNEKGEKIAPINVTEIKAKPVASIKVKRIQNKTENSNTK